MLLLREGSARANSAKLEKFSKLWMVMDKQADEDWHEIAVDFEDIAFGFDVVMPTHDFYDGARAVLLATCGKHLIGEALELAVDMRIGSVPVLEAIEDNARVSLK